MRRFAAELSAIVACAALLATASNFLAGRERKLAPVGQYPNALVVPGSASQSGPDPRPAPIPAPFSAPATAPTPAPATSPAFSASSAGKAPGERSDPSTVAKASPSPPGSAPAAPSAAAGSAGKGAPGLLARFPPHPDRPFVEIAGSDALWAHGQGVPFLDARRTKVFEEGHVAGARPFAVWESDVDQKVFAFQDEVPSKDRPVVLYCSGGDCEDSHMLAEKMFGAGFTNVLVYRDGWPDWQKRGGPARTGTAP